MRRRSPTAPAPLLCRAGGEGALAATAGQPSPAHVPTPATLHDHLCGGLLLQGLLQLRVRLLQRGQEGLQLAKQGAGRHRLDGGLGAGSARRGVSYQQPALCAGGGGAGRGERAWGAAAGARQAGAQPAPGCAGHARNGSRAQMPSRDPRTQLRSGRHLQPLPAGLLLVHRVKADVDVLGSREQGACNAPCQPVPAAGHFNRACGAIAPDRHLLANHTCRSKHHGGSRGSVRKQGVSCRPVPALRSCPRPPPHRLCGARPGAARAAPDRPALLLHHRDCAEPQQGGDYRGHRRQVRWWGGGARG